MTTPSSTSQTKKEKEDNYRSFDVSIATGLPKCASVGDVIPLWARAVASRIISLEVHASGSDSTA
eukprot:scaffold23368_cov71-Skeletonema_dohrnii-CCMP3373.AAC.2